MIEEQPTLCMVMQKSVSEYKVIEELNYANCSRPSMERVLGRKDQ